MIAYTETNPIVYCILLRPDMLDSEITSNRCNHIWLCNHSLDGDTIQLQNDGRPSDVAQAYASSACTHCHTNTGTTIILIGNTPPHPITNTFDMF